MSRELRLRVNGADRQVPVEAGMLLVDCIRGPLGLTGTHQGCDTAQCGACTVLVDGRAIKSCNVLAAQVGGRELRTVEGLADADGTLHVMQQAFSRHHALQCGFCTPGLLMRAVAMAREPKAAERPIDPHWVRHALSGNLCRCTGYEGIVKAVCEGLETMQTAAAR